MYVTKPSAPVSTDAVSTRQVVLHLNSSLYTLEGGWEWDMLSDAVYCSDVMFNFPEDFEGTKSIIHPDDKEQIIALLSEQDSAIPQITFRIITTYGEVKTISGADVTYSTSSRLDVANPAQVLDNIQKQKKQEDELTTLLHVKDMAEVMEGLVNTGAFSFNISTGHAFYSDKVFKIFRLPPQSLNVQLYTFASFIHPEDKPKALEAIDTSIRRQLPLDIYYRIVLLDDEVKYIQHTTRIRYNSRGETVVMGIMRDITTSLAIEKDLQAYKDGLTLHNKLQLLNEQMTTSGKWYIDLLTRKVYFSENYYRLFGLKPQAAPFTLKTFLQYVHPDDYNAVKESCDDAILRHTPPDLDFRILYRDGNTRHMRQKGKVATIGSSDLFMLVSVKDVTTVNVASKKLEQLTAEAFVKDFAYQQAEAMAEMAGFYLDPISEDIKWSPNIGTVLNIRNSNNLTLRQFLKYIYPADRKKFEEQLNVTLTLRQPTELQIGLLTRGDSALFRCKMKIGVSEKTEVLVCLLQNISEATRLQRSLRERIQFIELVSDSIQDKIIVTDSNNTIIEWNKAAEDGFKLKKADVLYKNFFEVFPELKQNEVFYSLRSVVSGEETITTLTTNAYLRTLHQVQYSVLKDADDTVLGVLHVMHDISKEEELKQTLSNRLNFIESLVEVSVDPIIVMDKNLNYLYWNRKSEQYFGINKEYAVGKNILELLPNTHNNPTHHQFRQALAGEYVHIPAVLSEEGTFREAYLVPITNEAKQVSGLLWMVKELTLPAQAT